MNIEQEPLLDGVYTAGDLEKFYRRRNLDSTRARIDFLAKTLRVSARDSEKYMSDAELLEMLECCVLAYPFCR